MTSEQALRKIRTKIFLYPDNKQDQADRVLAYLKKRTLRDRPVIHQAIGPYSGLTQAELRATGKCETDWY